MIKQQNKDIIYTIIIYTIIISTFIIYTFKYINNKHILLKWEKNINLNKNL